MIKSTIINNPYGKNWLGMLRQSLPNFDLNISENRLLIDGNRRALFILGHKTINSKAYIGQTKITSFDDKTLEVRTTIMLPHIIIGFIGPIIAIVFVWVNIDSLLGTILGTLMFIVNPLYYLWDIVKQEKFGKLLGQEIEKLSNL